MTCPKLATECLSVFYGEQRALGPTTITLKDGQLTALLGPRGSGKRTLLRALNRLLEAKVDAQVSGKVLLDGQDIYGKELTIRQTKARIGMLFPVPAIFPGSIQDNLHFAMKLHGIKGRTQRDQRVQEALELTDLWAELKDRLHTPAASLMQEQKHRLCLARLLTLRPEVLLLDNPWQSIDIGSRTPLEEVIHALRGQYTILASVNMIDLAGRISDETIFLLGGNVVESGPTEELFYRPQDKRTCDFINGRLQWGGIL